MKDPEKGKPLRYIFQGCRTARVGKFRIIYEVVENSVVFHYFEHEKKVYRK
ncbi:MAG: type II toxin-antitoxin system RelE/ParE family toxin [Thermoplasmata archaeon]|nr:type II toxin-antitoxin system RelE/ParE family toxin [Thermoplasmata archaeon]